MVLNGVNAELLSCSPPQLATVGEHHLPQEVSQGELLAKLAREKMSTCEICSRESELLAKLAREKCKLRLRNMLAKRT